MSLNLKSLVTVIGCSFALVACVPHLNEQQCKSISWYQIGVEDGSHGKFQRDLTRAISDCSKFNLSVNTADYSKGWHAGTMQFCQPNRAYQLGISGQTFNHVCPASVSASFNRSWRRGLRVFCVPAKGYDLGRHGEPKPNFCAPDLAPNFDRSYQAGFLRFQKTRDLESQLEHMNGEIKETQAALDQKTRLLHQLNSDLARGVDPSGVHLTPATRANLRSHIRHLRRDVAQLRQQLADQTAALKRIRYRLSQMSRM